MEEVVWRPPVQRMALAVFALVGLLIASYLLLYKLNVLGSIACGTGACETVQSSPWAVFLGVPVPAWGVGGYALILMLALLGLQPAFAERRWLSVVIVATASFAFGFSLYLTAVEAFLIHAWCRWCIASALVATLIFIAALFELPLLKRPASRAQREAAVV
jgi:uncharacterized membrane protein